MLDAIELNIFSSRISAVCDEMGAVLRRVALSPNIKDRLDFSCAVFDAGGELCAQAAHIPVHLGSMAWAMHDIVGREQWSPGDMLIVNDPYLGGTHLPDVTLVSPVFVDGIRIGFVANRAHHADIGAQTPGSMPISRTLDEEGIIIPPTFIARCDVINEAVLSGFMQAMRNPWQSHGDFAAQISANRRGAQRLEALVRTFGVDGYRDGVVRLNEYAERMARSMLREIPDGIYHFMDYMDDDGAGASAIPIRACVQVVGSDIHVDFTGTARQVGGNINCPQSVTAAAVYYVFRCLMPARTPACIGAFRPLTLSVPEGCLLNARRPAAVAAGNVETSTRVVDVILGALASALPDRIPAASQGSMNNVALGGRGPNGDWDYYETLGGGMGAGLRGGGLSAIQSHMTNTLNTPIESLEQHYPLRIRRYEIRRGSGGSGLRNGGDGLVREYEFLAPTTVTLITERRRYTPWGLDGGLPGMAGENRHNGRVLSPKCSISVDAADRVTVATPGGGGWGKL